MSASNVPVYEVSNAVKALSYMMNISMWGIIFFAIERALERYCASLIGTPVLPSLFLYVCRLFILACYVFWVEINHQLFIAFLKFGGTWFIRLGDWIQRTVARILRL